MAVFDPVVAERPRSKLSDYLQYLFLGADTREIPHIVALVAGSL
jgi:hypothetical protein